MAELVPWLTAMAAAMLVFALLGSLLHVVQALTVRAMDFLEAELRQLFVFTHPVRWLLAWAGLVMFVLALLIAGWLPVPALVVALLVVLFGPRWLLHRLKRRRALAVAQDLPDALQELASSLRAGASLTGALQVMVEHRSGPLGQEFSLLLREQHLGTRLDVALENLGERVRSEDMDLFIAATMIAHEMGGNLAEILMRLADTLRRKSELEGKVRSLTAQGVMQGRFVTLLPLFLVLVLYRIEHEAMRPLFTSLLGWGFLAVFLLLLLIGAFLIRKTVSIEI